MSTSQRIAYSIGGFVALFSAVIAIGYALAENSFAETQVAPTATTLLVGGGVILTIIIFPILMLKKFSKLSRDIEHDDSKFETSRFAEHQERPNIQYH
jgi:hypothetical protein